MTELRIATALLVVAHVCCILPCLLAVGKPLLDAAEKAYEMAPQLLSKCIQAVLSKNTTMKAPPALVHLVCEDILRRSIESLKQRGVSLPCTPLKKLPTITYPMPELNRHNGNVPACFGALKAQVGHLLLCSFIVHWFMID